jgi:hypothetical protein
MHPHFVGKLECAKSFDRSSYRKINMHLDKMSYHGVDGTAVRNIAGML